MKLIDLTGQRFGILTALRVASRDRSGLVLWQCLCDCGQEKAVYSCHLRRGNTKSCGCTRVRIGPRHSQWTGCGEVSGNFMDGVRRCADGSKGKRTTVPFEIDATYVWELFLKQERKCALSGVLLTIPRRPQDGGNASLDRIDSSKGYVHGNVQWVHKDVNRMKNVFDQQYFIDTCKKIATNCKG